LHESSRRAGAALALAILLFALQLIRPAPPPAVCPASGELRAEAGHSVELACLGPGAGRPVRGPARTLVGLPIDPNRADAATLETLPGVGPARALAIFEARRERPFQRVEDLERVPGIGPRILAGLAGRIEVTEAPASQASEGGGAGSAGAVPARRAPPAPSR
jgi:competence protein ComEA